MTERQHYMSVLKHRGYVRAGINQITHDLQARAQRHNKSLTETDEEKYSLLGDTDKVNEIHFSKNDHHPEFFSGIAEMNINQIIEMLCDWQAEWKLEPTKDLNYFVYYKCKMYGVSEQMTNVLLNTLPLIEIK